MRVTKLLVLVVAATGTAVVLVAAAMLRNNTSPVEAAPVYGVVARPMATSAGPAPTAERHVPENVIERLQLRRGEIRHLATFRVRGGKHSLFMAPTAKGETCLVEDVESGTTPDGRPLRVYGGSCSPDVWLGHEIAWTMHSGGATDRATPITLVGVARSSVAAVALVNLAGERRLAALTSTSAFVFDLSAAENAAFDPVAIVALSRGGNEIDRMSLR